MSKAMLEDVIELAKQLPEEDKQRLFDWLQQHKSTSFDNKEVASSSNPNKYQEIISKLESASSLNNEELFLQHLQSLDLIEKTQEVYLKLIKLALEAGAHFAARRLSNQAYTLYPENSQLQHYAKVLAPPKFIRSYSASNLSVKNNRDWMKKESNRYQDKWVALKDGQLVAFADTFSELSSKVVDTTDVLMTKVY
jgi:hypothetical protein